MTATRKTKTKPKTKTKTRARKKRQVNYAENYRKSKDYHAYTFDLPRGYLTKSNIEKARQSKALNTHIRYNNPTVEEITKIIHRSALDMYINDKLTPARRTAITSVWEGRRYKDSDGIRQKKPTGGLKKFVEQVDRNVFSFVKVKNANRKKRYSNSKRTSKGVFLQQSNTKAKEIKIDGVFGIEITDIKKAKPQYIKKGKRKIKIPEIRKVLFPFKQGINIQEYVEYLLEKYKPLSSVFYLKGYGSNTTIADPYDAIDFLGYAFDYIETQQQKGQGHPYSGILLSWY